jgi:beta-lactamase superfamily II metal-dependent hydrolase
MRPKKKLLRGNAASVVLAVSIALVLCFILVFFYGCLHTPALLSEAPSSTQAQIPQDGANTGMPYGQAAREIRGNISGNLTVHFIDVGKGDAILVQTPMGKTLLIDAGKSATSERVVAYIRDQGISSLDIVAATHPHDDHIGGMGAVISAIPVKRYIDNGYKSRSHIYRQVMDLVHEKSIPNGSVRAGDTIDLDPALNITVLNPQTTFLTGDDPVERSNENGIVIRIQYGSTAFLFTADTGEAAENAMLAGGRDLHSRVLKVGHHGNAHSSTRRLLEAVHPEIAVISTGSDGISARRPSLSTISRLNAIGAAVYRTDKDGTIRISTDGSTLDVSAQKTIRRLF